MSKVPKSELPQVPCRRTRHGVAFSVRVRPRASRVAVEGLEGDTLLVRLTAPPADGEANAQLIKLLAKEFGVKKSSLRIVKGETSRDKVLEIEGPASDKFTINE